MMSVNKAMAGLANMKQMVNETLYTNRRLNARTRYTRNETKYSHL